VGADMLFPPQEGEQGQNGAGALLAYDRKMVTAASVP
jgi:hypothetical protein